jgi:dTMP kinase
MAEREVVDHDHLVAALHQRIDEVGADEAGSSCYGGTHTPYRRRSVFISFEGHDGSGKTTQSALLADWLRAEGHDVLTTREPGGTPLGEAIRDVVLHGHEMTPWAEATLFASARAEHVHEVISPALARGTWVVCDRYVDSSVVYQGIARGLGVETVLELNRAVTGGLMPARTFVLALEADAARRRQGNAYLDRIERESEDFRRVVADGYRELAILFPKRVALLDASLPVDTISEQVREHVRAV